VSSSFSSTFHGFLPLLSAGARGQSFPSGHAAVAAKLRRSAPTIDLRVDYVRLAAGARLLATAEPVRIGRNIGLVDIRVTDDQDTLVAVGRCVFSTQDRG